MNQSRMPSPAILVAVLALVTALAGTAMAGPGASTSAINKKKVKKIATKQINKLAPGLSVANATSADTATNATNANNADTLAGQGPSAFQTASASNRDTDGVQLSATDQFVLSTTITIPSTNTVTAVASVEAVGDGGDDDLMNCNLEIAGTEGARQSLLIQDTSGPVGDVATLPLTQARTLGAGTHTVRVSCNENNAGNVNTQDGSLSVVATG